jgi:tetratricopeptide (TPR) repeat protein
MPNIASTATAPARWQEAERQLDAGRPEIAAAGYRSLLDHPQLAPAAHLRLSMIAGSQGRYRESVDAAMAAFASRVAEPDLLQAIGKGLMQLGETRAALACAMDPAVSGGSSVQVQTDMGRMLANHYLPAEALQLLEGARRNGVRGATLDYLIGMCRMQVGDAEGARREFETALQAAPGMASALRGITRLGRRPDQGDAHVERLRAAIDARDESDADLPLLLYSLFAELDRADDTDAAWPVLERGMRLRRRQVEHSEDAEEALFAWLGALQPAPATGYSDDGPRPLFIVGMPRSGTTLLERILGHHTMVADAGELHDFVRQMRWCADVPGRGKLDLPLAQAAERQAAERQAAGQQNFFEELGRRYLDHTRWRARGKPVYTDKMPLNFMAVPWIARALPQARILHMVRGPMDTCFSNLKEWFGGAYNYSYDQSEMGNHFRRYRTLMAHWRRLYPERILDVRYDELVEDPPRVMREVLEFCGLPWEEGLEAIEKRSDAVSTASAMQVREPIDGRFLQQWRRYEAHLGPLRERLGALAY